MNDFNHRLDLLRERYSASLPSKREALVKAWRAVQADPADAAHFNQLQTLVHRLAGSATAYGYEELGELAGVVNALLKDSRLMPDMREVSATVGPAVTRLLKAMAAALPHARAQRERVAGTEQMPLRVILSEDDDEQAGVIEQALLAAGCEVTLAARSDLLWERITAWPCDAVVVDYWLEGETALDIVRIIRAESSFNAVALICLTVETHAELLRDVLKNGCDAVVAKSESSAHLIEVVRTQVAARRAKPM